MSKLRVTAAGVTKQLVLVCSACQRASCLAGQYYCDRARGAGTMAMTVDDLRRLGLESPHYWVVRP